MKSLLLTMIMTFVASGFVRATENSSVNSNPAERENSSTDAAITSNEESVALSEATSSNDEVTADSQPRADGSAEPNLLQPWRRYPGDRFGRYPRHRWPGRYYRGYRGQVLCESRGYAYTECYTGPIRNAGILSRHSRSSCEYGYSWGIYGDRIWVDQGCRATFWVSRYNY